MTSTPSTPVNTLSLSTANTPTNISEKSVFLHKKRRLLQSLNQEEASGSDSDLSESITKFEGKYNCFIIVLLKIIIMYLPIGPNWSCDLETVRERVKPNQF